MSTGTWPPLFVRTTLSGMLYPLCPQAARPTSNSKKGMIKPEPTVKLDIIQTI